MFSAFFFFPFPIHVSSITFSFLSFYCRAAPSYCNFLQIPELRPHSHLGVDYFRAKGMSLMAATVVLCLLNNIWKLKQMWLNFAVSYTMYSILNCTWLVLFRMCFKTLNNPCLTFKSQTRRQAELGVNAWCMCLGGMFITDAVAASVEQASAVLVCITKKYENSRRAMAGKWLIVSSCSHASLCV